MQKADGVPKLCHAIEQNLCVPDEKRKSPLHNFLTLKEFEKWVVEDVGIRLNEDERKVSVEYLDSSGIVSNQTIITSYYYFGIDCESGSSNLSSTTLVVS